jgi:hypothetical protein
MGELAARKYGKSDKRLSCLPKCFQMSAIVWKRRKVWHKAKTAS